MPSAEAKKKLNAIWLSLLTAIFLTILKLTIGVVTQSVAILSLAVDSLGDVLSSIFNLFFLKQAQKPADEDHHYGHGKFENFGSFLQSIILMSSTGFVIYHAVEKLVHREMVYQVNLGIGTVMVCFIVSFMVGQRVKRIGRESQSELLKVEATHLLMDSYLYFIVIMGLIFSYFGFPMFDPIACFMVAGYIGVVAFRIIKISFDVLMDKSLTEEENKMITGIIKDHYPSILGFDRFQTRRSGSRKFINVRLFLCKKISLGQAHTIVDHIEKEIENEISNSEVMVHPEPTMDDCLKHDHELHPRHFSKSD